MNNDKVKFVTEIGIFSALGLALDYIASIYSAPFWQKGGSISVAMVVIFLMGLKWGLKGGLLTGLIVGTIQILWGYAIGVGQVFLDYVLPYTVLGLVGLCSNCLKLNNKVKKNIIICIAILIVCILRTIFHVLSGIIYFETPFWGSLLYNGPFMLMSTPLCMIITCVLIDRLQFFRCENNIK